MAERLPTSTLLRSGSPAQRDLVRVTLTVRGFLGFGVDADAKKLAKVISDKAPTMVGAYLVASPEISGGTVLVDMAIIRSQSVLRLSQGLERLGRGVTVQSVERITRRELATAEQERTTERRQQSADEAEEARAARATTLGGLAEGALRIGRMIRGVVILVVIGAGIWVAAPFLKTASQALNLATKKRRAARG